MSGGPVEPIAVELTRSLATPEAYPGDAGARAGVTEIQTHISHVFLTRDRVYKVRKSVDLGFVSFQSRAERNADCVREVNLNRRLAPDVYLGTAAIEPHGEAFVVGEVDPNPSELPPQEHCVVMRRLPSGRDASALVDAGALEPEWLERVAWKLARFHETQCLGRPSPFSPEEWRAAIWGPVVTNFDVLLSSGCPSVSARDVGALQARAEAAFARLKLHFEERRITGRAVDAHGDLHLEHIWFETDDAAPLIIDCLEFSDSLRRIDAASEIAFLAMDLGFRNRTDLAEHLLAHYAAAADDLNLYAVVDFFVSYRAAVRAKVEAIASQDPRIAAAQREASAVLAAERVAFAVRALGERPPGCVFLVGGVIGCGKSTVARALRDALHVPVISSDVVRQSAALPEQEDGKPGGDGTDRWQVGRYAPDATERIYDQVLSRAAPVVESGRSVILDASWARRDRRQRALAWATERGARSVFVEVQCGREETLARLAARQREGTDASEAGPELYDAFAAAFEVVREDEWPAHSHWTIQTDRETWRAALHARCAEAAQVASLT